MLPIILALFSVQASAQGLVSGGNGTVAISANIFVLGTATSAAVGGGTGYVGYQNATTTTTTSGGGEVVFSTLTVLANSFNKAGQQVHITCLFMHSASANAATPHLRSNLNGVLTDQSASSAQSTASRQIWLEAYLTWQAHNTFSNRSWGIMSGTAITNTTAASQTLDETTPLSFNCSCSAPTANGDCSFVDMRVEWLGM